MSLAAICLGDTGYVSPVRIRLTCSTLSQRTSSGLLFEIQLQISNTDKFPLVTVDRAMAVAIRVARFLMNNTSRIQIERQKCTVARLPEYHSTAPFNRSDLNQDETTNR
jgi:hypothetical protein